jgi:hypothetical protein
MCTEAVFLFIASRTTSAATCRDRSFVLESLGLNAGFGRVRHDSPFANAGMGIIRIQLWQGLRQVARCGDQNVTIASRGIA